jgi:hypothetical protein
MPIQRFLCGAALASALALAACSASASPPAGAGQFVPAPGAGVPSQGDAAATERTASSLATNHAAGDLKVTGEYDGTYTETEGSRSITDPCKILIRKKKHKFTGIMEVQIGSIEDSFPFSGTVRVGRHGAKFKFAIQNPGGPNAPGTATLKKGVFSGSAVEPAHDGHEKVDISFTGKRT